MRSKREMGGFWNSFIVALLLSFIARGVYEIVRRMDANQTNAAQGDGAHEGQTHGEEDGSGPE